MTLWESLDIKQNWKNMNCPQIGIPGNEENKLPTVGSQDLCFSFSFLDITLGSQSALPDFHFEPSGIDFGPQIEYKNKNRIEMFRVFSINTIRMPASNRRVPKRRAAVTRRMASSINGFFVGINQFIP